MLVLVGFLALIGLIFGVNNYKVKKEIYVCPECSSKNFEPCVCGHSLRCGKCGYYSGTSTHSCADFD